MNPIIPVISCSDRKEKQGRWFFFMICIFGLFFLLFYYILTYKQNYLYISNPFSFVFPPKKFDRNLTNFQDSNVTLYMIGDMTPKSIQIHNDKINYTDYLDRNFSMDCGIPSKHEQLFHLMKFWFNFTSSHDIPWWLVYGSLIGSLRYIFMGK